MFIRSYHATDQQAVLALIQQTIRTVNIRDYTAHQVAVWSAIGETTWQDSLEGHQAFVAFDKERLVGFSDVTPTGYIDRVYVHHAYQGQGIGKALLKKIEEQVSVSTYSVAASITARPFFEKQGYQVIKENHVTLRDVVFLNYLMERVIT